MATTAHLSAGVRVAGCDLGKAIAKFAVGVIDREGVLRIETHVAIPHDGKPLEVFKRWYRDADIASCAALGATGLFADELVAPVIAGLPEDACLQAAVAQLPELAGALNIVSIGARGYSVMTRSASGHVSHLENDKCSSGTGETMVKIAGRFGLTIEQADRLARTTDTSIPITARCSVFAKSEMTHFGNQGRPAAELFHGYFGSVASFVAALMDRVRVDGPVILIGGGARIESLGRGLRDAVGSDVQILPEGQVLEAMGAAILAAEQHRGDTLDPLPTDSRSLVQAKQRRFRVLEPPRAFASRTRRLDAPPPMASAEQAPTILGIDLGSTGSKAVLTSIESGEMVLDLYDGTRGNPVEAAQRLIARLTGEHDLDVRALGLTGSGREAAATIMRAAFPDMTDRIGVINEIVAHATAAIRCDDEAGRSLSVVEIGGQDAKFIQIVDGQIVESDMNKACSAGTGSFLEEQAVFYGVHDILEFTERACEAERPPDLGQMCTVFVAEAAAAAHSEGFSLEDLFGGFQYSVIHNYINRVMGQRTFGDRIFFQGKPASGPALGWTLAGVTGREVLIPPNPGAMGAWGIGVHLRTELGVEVLEAAPPFDLRRVLSATVAGRKEIQCRDKKCATLCNISKTMINVNGANRVVLSGGACPKYEVSSAGRQKLPVEAPSAFDARAALLEPYLAASNGSAGAVVGLPIAGATYGVVPWLVTLLRELGLSVRTSVSSPESLATGEGLCYSYDACAPVKIAHALADPGIDTLFLPKLISLPDQDGRGGTSCPMEQALPEMVTASLRARGWSGRAVAPTLMLADGLDTVKLGWELMGIASELGVSRRLVPRALRAAAAAQRRYARDLAAIGYRTLSYARGERIPVVVVCGSLHAIHDSAVNAEIPRLLRENGVLPLPMDCLPIPRTTPEVPRAAWADANRALRAAITARARGDVYPLMLSSFGCGPLSFTEQIFASLMEGYPHTSLESDGHGGTAGYVTRVQAFLHTVRQHRGAPSPISGKRLRMLEPLAETPVESDKDARLVMFNIADRLSPIMAAAFRSSGFDAVSSGPSSAELLALGRRDCTGKECVAYQLIWGGFRQHLERDDSGKRLVLMQVSGEGRCRNCMFSVKDQLSLERMGLEDTVSVRHYRSESQIALPFSTKIWMGVTAWDLLLQLASYHRPVERRAGEVDYAYRDYCDEIEAIMERPLGGGRSELAATRTACLRVLRRAAIQMAELANRAAADPRLRTVLLSGDVYVRIDEFASDSLIRRLNERGVRVIVEPTSMISEYMAEERLSELMGLPTTFFANQLSKRMMKRLRRAFQAEVRAHHPWLPTPDVVEIIAASREVLDRYPEGEAPVTIGSVLHHWRTETCDGVVVASPWGCGPALISEALMRHQRDIPMLFLYSDGSPVDERRLNAFAFRLRRTERRARPSAHAPGCSRREARLQQTPAACAAASSSRNGICTVPSRGTE